MPTQEEVEEIGEFLPQWHYKPKSGISIKSTIPLSGLRRLLQSLLHDLPDNVELTRGSWDLFPGCAGYLLVEIGIHAKRLEPLFTAARFLERELQNIRVLYSIWGATRGRRVFETAQGFESFGAYDGTKSL